MRDCWLASRNHRDRAVCGASTQHMADHLRSLHAQELQADGGGDTHLTKKQCLPSENEKDLQCEQHHQASHESGAGVPQASDMANETSNQYDSMTQTAQAGFYMLETRVSVTDAKVSKNCCANLQCVHATLNVWPAVCVCACTTCVQTSSHKNRR